MLTVSEDVKYAFEPFWRALVNMSASRDVPADKVHKMTARLLSGDEGLIKSVWKPRSRAEKVPKAKNSLPTVIKTVRLMKQHLLPWILKANVKIVHLIRDPRAVYYSMKKMEYAWTDRLTDMKTNCQTMEENMELGTILGPSRYYLIKYEDLIQDTVSELKKIYAFMDIPFGREEEEYAKQLSQVEAPKPRLKSYFSIVRQEGYDSEQWKSKLSLKDIYYVQSSCFSFMKAAAYELIK